MHRPRYCSASGPPKQSRYAFGLAMQSCKALHNSYPNWFAPASSFAPFAENDIAQEHEIENPDDQFDNDLSHQWRVQKMISKLRLHDRRHVAGEKHVSNISSKDRQSGLALEDIFLQQHKLYPQRKRARGHVGAEDRHSIGRQYVEHQ